MGIEPKNYILSLADSTPLAAVTRSNPRHQCISTRFWTTVGLQIQVGSCARIAGRDENLESEWAWISPWSPA